MKNKKFFQLIVRAIIKDKNGNILMVERVKNPEKDKWVLPGGRVEFGEESPKAIVREIKEELNLDFTIQTNFFKDDFKSVPGFHCLVIYFSGKTKGNIKLKTDEDKAYRFISIKDIKKSRQIGFDHKEVLLKRI